jgi:hypothetical protein
MIDRRAAAKVDVIQRDSVPASLEQSEPSVDTQIPPLIDPANPAIS